MKWLNGDASPMDGCRAFRQKCSKSLRPSSQNTDMSVRMKSACLRETPLLLMRTKTCDHFLIHGREFQPVNG